MSVPFSDEDKYAEDYATFQFRVEDNGGIDLEDRIMTIDVLSV